MTKEIPYGPAMLALSEQDRKFVHGLYEHDNNFVRAMAFAGYQGRPADLDDYGRHLALHPDIQAAVAEMRLPYVQRATPKAVNTVVAIMNDPLDKQRLAAANTLMNRTGFAEKQVISVEHKVTLDDRGTLARVAQLGKELGMDPRKLLGNRASQVIDLTAVDVSGPEPAKEDFFDPDEEF